MFGEDEILDRRIDWPILRDYAHAYVVSRYGRKEDRRYLSHDDLKSHADYALVKLLQADLPDKLHGAQFWVMLRNNIDWEFNRVWRAKDIHEGVIGSYDAVGRDDDREPGDRISSLRVAHRDSLIVGMMADHIATAVPTALKVILGLFFFEELNQEEVGELAGAAKQTIQRWMKEMCEHIVDHARTQVIEHPIEPRPLPKMAPLYVANILANAETFIQERYGVDLPSWLGWVQLSYRVDVSYLVDMIDSGNGHRIRRDKPRLDRAADVATLEQMDPLPATVNEVMERLGWAHSRARLTIMEWRRKHGIETPPGGGHKPATIRYVA